MSAAAMAFTLIPTATAADEITTTINGTREERTLSKITFDGGEMITLTFSDNTSETTDMSLVEITFALPGESSLDIVEADDVKPEGVYDLKGVRVADRPEGLMPGVYIVNGLKILVK